MTIHSVWFVAAFFLLLLWNLTFGLYVEPFVGFRFAVLQFCIRKFFYSITLALSKWNELENSDATQRQLLFNLRICLGSLSFCPKFLECVKTKRKKIHYIHSNSCLFPQHWSKLNGIWTFFQFYLQKYTQKCDMNMISSSHDVFCNFIFGFLMNRSSRLARNFYHNEGDWWNYLLSLHIHAIIVYFVCALTVYDIISVC